MRWYAAPHYTFRDDAAVGPMDRAALLVDEYGQQIAEFERLRDAEAAAIAYNTSFAEEEPTWKRPISSDDQWPPSGVPVTSFPKR